VELSISFLSLLFQARATSLNLVGANQELGPKFLISLTVGSVNNHVSGIRNHTKNPKTIASREKHINPREQSPKADDETKL
jgi:hypothetical protein